MNECKICNEVTTTIEDVKKKLDILQNSLESECLHPNITRLKSSVPSSARSLLAYYRCSHCGFVFLDDEHRVDVAREKKQYDQHNNSLENEGYVQMFEDFIEVSIAPYLKNISTALDFGSGPTPVFSELLKRRGLEVDIYDLYYAPKKVYEEKTYDLITSTEVFEHLSKPLETLQLLTEHLNEGGYIVLMTKFPPKEDEAFLSWWYRRDPTHISFFTPKSFDVMAETVGLRVLKTINENIVVFQKN